MSKHFNAHPYIAHGLVSVEFALLSTVLFLALFAMLGFARAVYIYNAASHATRLGARIAVVCDKDSAAIKSKMMASVPGLATGNITVAYSPAGCSANNCSTVTVSITGFNVVIATPSRYPLNNLVVPSFSTTLIRESMSSANNSICS